MKRILILAIFFVFGFGLAFAWPIYKAWMLPIVGAELDGKPFYIPSGSDSSDVLRLMKDVGLELHERWGPKLMERKQYTGSNVEPGYYVLEEGMSLNDLLNQLRGGHGEKEVRITFQSARTMNELAGKVALSIEADSISLLQLLTDPEMASRYGFNRYTFKSMFLPDTYFAEWDTDAMSFVERMAREYKQFWDEARLQKARALGMSQSEVSTLASIVQAEQQLHAEERPIIAGLYLNRLNRGMRLQSDPTVVFAIGDFSINRVLSVHLQVDHPFNTYKYPGLPPGPINVPQKSSIDAVLNPGRHNYLYMCAKSDFSGLHAFAKSLTEHNRNAAAYRKALNERKIYR